MPMRKTIFKQVDKGARKLVLDLSKLEYIDSAAIGMIIACQGHINAVGCQMRVAGPQGSVQLRNCP